MSASCAHASGTKASPVAVASPGLSWFAIARLGLVQTALGAIVVLTTSTLNRVMVVELSMAAVIPGALVALHYAIQILRPLWGYGSDRGRARTPWIVGGMALLALSGTGAAAATALAATHPVLGVALAALAFAGIGIGVGSAGTSLLALLASRVAPERRAASATIVWLMMIAGMVVTAIVTGSLIDPFSFSRLVAITAAVGAIAFALTLAAVFGIERTSRPLAADRGDHDRPIGRRDFAAAFAAVWQNREARLFTIFVFISMLAYSAQDLILEPFAGLAFAMTPGETTSLSGLQHAGVFAGMAAAGLIGSLLARRIPTIVRRLAVIGCTVSALALLGLAAAPSAVETWPLAVNIVLLGLGNGIFAVAAIGSMMALAGATGGRGTAEGAGGRETGLRMGLWGAAQAFGFGLGGFGGTVGVDLIQFFTGATTGAYVAVFIAEALLFVVSAAIAARLGGAVQAATKATPTITLQPAE